MSEISKSLLSKFEKKELDNPNTKLLRNALYKSNLANLAFDGEELAKTNYIFNVDIKTMASTNQKSSGRCWLFAATNLLREKMAKEKILQISNCHNHGLHFGTN